ncbi:glycosyltransferase family 4 protein [Sphingomonas sp. AP4-R1]|uniref:glycosyltransferase family 4 protein n=1 Tax=Sphingomonas sp. AP4-R1 TaxID=2735134 RepID=UPI001C109AC2|nr:glycosyltransferase [Sphingomonas sp. AP4-R1]
MRLTIVQYAGDYREAFERFASGGKATYQAQRYSVDFVGSLAARLEQVSVVCALGDTPSDVVLANGVRAVNVGLGEPLDVDRLLQAVAATRPDRLCIVTPVAGLIRWGIAQRLPMLLTLADSFKTAGLREKLRAWRLARLLAHDRVEWIGNHGLNACLSLLSIGASPRKVIPWDWPPSFNPHDRAAKARAAGPARIVYVGAIEEAKGVGDVLEAVALLRGEGVAAEATFYGAVKAPDLPAMAERLGLGGVVRFAGLVANEDVPGIMAAADYVVVPSRHEYPEGLPLTIYEALASRTPLVASDHPMFRGALVDGRSARIFAAGSPRALADALAGLERAPALYAALSEGGAAAWDALQLPVTWGALVEHWLEGEAGWLADHAVASGRYDARLAERRAALRGA